LQHAPPIIHHFPCGAHLIAHRSPFTISLIIHHSAPSRPTLHPFPAVLPTPTHNTSQLLRSARPDASGGDHRDNLRSRGIFWVTTKTTMPLLRNHRRRTTWGVIWHACCTQSPARQTYGTACSSNAGLLVAATGHGAFQFAQSSPNPAPAFVLDVSPALTCCPAHLATRRIGSNNHPRRLCNPFNLVIGEPATAAAFYARHERQALSLLFR
jgi:hypothetical protein